MAKRGDTLDVRKRHDRPRDDESLLMRSAESIGRMIGALQRQLDGASQRVSDAAGRVVETLPDLPLAGTTPAGESTRRPASATGAMRKSAKPERVTRKAVARKRTAPKGVARKNAARKRTSSTRKAAGTRPATVSRAPASRKRAATRKR
jgi:hypothetical protein